MISKKYFIVLCLVSLLFLLSSPVHAISASDFLKEQQDLTAKINKNRSNIADLTANIARLNSKIESGKAGLIANARAVQVANPSNSMISMILSSHSISELLEQIVAVNMIVNTTNAQTKDMEKSSKEESRSLEALNAAQVELDQSQQALTLSLQEYQTKAEPAVKFTPKSEKTDTPGDSGTADGPIADNPASDTSFPVSEAQARANIVARESGGNYTVRNGNFYGAYQLDISYLKGDLSPANQDRTAQTYVTQRYGSWSNAWTFWQTHHWY